MRYFCPTLMDQPETTDKETFLALMLKRRPEYAIVWDVIGKDVIDFQSRVWVVQYVVIAGDKVYYNQSRHYAKRALTLFSLKGIVHVELPEQWQQYLPEAPQFKPIQYYAPELVEKPTETDLEDFINKMLQARPPFAVLWNVTFEEVTYMASRVYVVSYMPVIGDTLYYSYAKHFAKKAQALFNIPKREKITIQNPQLE